MKAMFMRSARLAGAALCTLLMVAPAQADDWVSKWSNGHKIENSEKGHKLKFGGRIMADYSFADADEVSSSVEDGFEFRRARLFFSGTIYERVEFKAQYDFAGGDANIRDLYIGIKNEWGSIRFGHQFEPFSLQALTSSKYIAFLERALPVEAFSPGRNSGVRLHGSQGDTLNWGVGAFYDADSFGDSTDEDRVNVTGRIGFRPFYQDKGARMLHLGVAATVKDTESTLRFRSRPEAHLSDRFVNTGNFAADGATLLGGELAGVFGPFWFSGEYMQADADAPAVGDPTFDGYYVQAGYYLTGEHRRFKPSGGAFDRQKPKNIFGKDSGVGAWEIAARISSLDLNDGAVTGGEIDNYSLALNWYLNPATRMMINYVHADVDTVGEADFILLRWSLDF
ncbi:MAG: porin [Acidobacteriota bacterium]